MTKQPVPGVYENFAGRTPAPESHVVDWEEVAEHYRLAMLEVERSISAQPIRELLPGQSINETARFLSDLGDVLCEARHKVIFKEPLFPAPVPHVEAHEAFLEAFEDFSAENKRREADLRAPQPNLSLTIGALQRAHVERQEEWCPDQKPDLSFRGNELGGECGEAQNVIKKLERERHGWRGSRDTVEHLAEELADVIHCAVLVAITAGIEIEPAVIAKFNSTSEKNGLSTFLAAEGSTE